MYVNVLTLKLNCSFRGGLLAFVLSIRSAAEIGAVDGSVRDSVDESERSGQQRSDRDPHETRDVIRTSAAQPAASAARDEASVAPRRLSSLRDAGVKLAVKKRNATNLLARLALVVRFVPHTGHSLW